MFSVDALEVAGWAARAVPGQDIARQIAQQLDLPLIDRESAEHGIGRPFAFARRVNFGACLSGEEGAIAKMLVVDDDRVVAEMYRLALSRAGHQVEVAHDGLAALKAASTNRPDIVFLDIRMPTMDGMEVLRNLASVKATRSIPVVMLSNYDEPGLVGQSLSLGAKQYLVKAGTNPAELHRIVSQWVEAP